MRPDQDVIVAQRTLLGVPGCKIAQEIGVHESTISRAKARVRTVIEGEYTELMVRGLRPSRRTLCRLAAMGSVKPVVDPDTGKLIIDKDMLKLSLDASKTILSHANGQPGTIINTLIQINQAPEQAQELQGIAAFLATQWQENPQIIESDNHIIIEADNDISMGIPTPHTTYSDTAQDGPDIKPGSCHELPITEANGQP